jgi:flagellar biosynthesis protein FlhG
MAGILPPTDSYPPPSAPPPGVRHVLAVAGGRGGVGTSILAVNIAVYVAQLGRSVVLVDASPLGASLHTMLDVPLPQPKLEEGEIEVDDFVLVPTPVPGLRLLPQAYSFGNTVPLRPGRKPRWARKLQKLDVDYVILDLGAGTNPSTLDLFASADLGMLVTVPDPPSVEGAYRFTCALFQRRLRRTLLKDRFRLRLLDRAEFSLPPLPTPQDLVRALARFDTGLAQLAARELNQLRPRLVINVARTRVDTELGVSMRDMAERYLGVRLDYVGHIEQDDTAWLSVARRRPLLIDGPTSKSARNIERIARRALALAARKGEIRAEPIPLVREQPTLYDVLLTHRGASDEELRRAYKRLRDIYREGSLPLTSLLDNKSLRSAQAVIDEANDTLLDPLRRRAYDVSTFPDTDQGPEPDTRERDLALQAERELMREELAEEINAQTIFTGALLRKVREAHGIKLQDISHRTKISASYLQAIEDDRFPALPASVYLRGFINEIAKYLKLDAIQVSRTYLKRYREWRTLQEQAGPR